MTDKKKVTKKTGKKVSRQAARKLPQASDSISVYQESLKRKSKSKTNKKRKVIRKGSKYLFMILFFIISFIFSRYILSGLVLDNGKIETPVDQCKSDVHFTEKEKEFLAISAMIKKPNNKEGRVDPCLKESSDQMIEINKEYSDKNEKGTLLSVLEMDEELRRQGKISKLSKQEEKSENLVKRLNKLETYSKKFNKDYPRIKIGNYFPENALYFGVVISDVNHVKNFLNEKRCDTPQFNYANNEISHLGSFFTVNAKRAYGGRVKTINNRYENLIEGEFALYEYPREPFHRFIPSGNFKMWVHKASNVNYKGYKYQRQWLSQEYRFDWDRSPWLYNSCRKSIATVSNYCALDPRQDMQYKDFFYLVKEDKIVGNIYCKKSDETIWNRLATFEFVRKN